jgi:hypothetical protein
MTDEIRILHSVHAADIGRLINPMQCRGQIDGAIAMGFGGALTENMVYDDTGKMVNPALRNCHIPAFADVLRTQVFFADTHDAIGPLGAKAQGECAINPVAPLSPMRPAFGSRICPSRRTESSTSSARHERPAKGNARRSEHRHPDAGARRQGRRIRFLVAGHWRRHRGIPRLHRTDGDAAEPAGPDRLGHPPEVRESRDGDVVPEFQRAA